MDAQVLVLDPSYLPVARVDWRRALTLLFMGKVEVVEEYEDKYVHSVTLEFKIPSIVRFIRAMRSKKKIVKFSRENVYMRDNGTCQYCGDKVQRASITYDHVIPRAQGGKTEWTNIVISCSLCNQKKGNRTPLQAGMMLRSMPIKPKKLSDHAFVTLQWRRGDPLSWRDWLASHSYWNGELDSD